MKNKVQLITYPDRFGGGTLSSLHTLLRTRLSGLFGSVHILPFFLPIDGADAGFDPVDHLSVDPQVGGWSDIRSMAKDWDVMADVIVNHVSDQSPQFRDFESFGQRSRFADLFLTKEKVFPNGPSENELKAIYRPRPGAPFTPVVLANGERHTLWTTFTPHQLDIDVESRQGKEYLAQILQVFSENGVKIVRLDAAGYAIKRRGTNCFMLEETFDFIREFTAAARMRDIEVLVEVHSYYRQQIEIAKHVDWVYDFALPPLILHAFAFGTAKYLAEWIGIRPNNALTVLDTHDGIGIIDIGGDIADPVERPGLVPAPELSALVEKIHHWTGGESRQATGAAASNLDLYQVNCTFYDALQKCDHTYLLSRAIQFFLPGIPQVYYVGLLAGSNDMELLAKTGVGRDINRHYYGEGEVRNALSKPVVESLVLLIRIRNTHPAFTGTFNMSKTSDTTFELTWVADAQVAKLIVDFERAQGTLSVSDDEQNVSELNLCRSKEMAA